MLFISVARGRGGHSIALFSIDRKSLRDKGSAWDAALLNDRRAVWPRYIVAERKRIKYSIAVRKSCLTIPSATTVALCSALCADGVYALTFVFYPEFLGGKSLRDRGSKDHPGNKS